MSDHAGSILDAQARAHMKVTEERARLDTHVDELAREVKRLRQVRDEVALMEAKGKSVEAVVGDKDFGRGISVNVTVSTADVIEQLSILDGKLQRSITTHLEAIAAFVQR